MAREDEWYVGIDGVSHGPMPFANLVQAASQGRISRETLVWAPGMQDWKEANEIKGLFHLPPPLPILARQDVFAPSLHEYNPSQAPTKKKSRWATKAGESAKGFVSVAVELLAVILAAGIAAFTIAAVPTLLADMLGASRPGSGLTKVLALGAGWCAGWWVRLTLADRRKRRVQSKANIST
jgi:hypothetical protein